MTTFFTSDTHYDHANVIKHAKRPFQDVHEMNQALIDNWNRVVSPQDHVYHLGDFTFSSKRERIVELLGQLNGSIHVIWGNHDKVAVKLHGKEPFDKLASASYYKEIEVQGQKIVLMHYGMRVWNKSHYGSWHLYGHSHATLSPHGRSVDVGVDSHWITGKPEYVPFSFEQVQAYMTTRDFVPVDHHGRGTT